MRKHLGVALLSAAAVAGSMVGVSPAGASLPGPTTFYANPNVQTYTVPSDACSLRIELWGGQGAGSTQSYWEPTPGAAGAVVGEMRVGSGNLLVAGDQLKVTVGYGGANGGSGVSNGSDGGGGASGVKLDGTSFWLAVAGGGGATAPQYGFSYRGGDGGSGGVIGTPWDNGGQGGNASGSIVALSPASGGTLNAPGTGATFSGAAENYPGADGQNAVLGTGGAGGRTSNWPSVMMGNGGGGGGGYYPGGGGAIASYDMGGYTQGQVSAGGGGSSYADSEFLPDHGLSSSSAGSNGDGSARFTPLACDSVTMPAASDTFYSGQSYTIPSSSDNGQPTTASFVSNSGTCQLNDHTVTFTTSAGVCAVRATSSGGNYEMTSSTRYLYVGAQSDNQIIDTSGTSTAQMEVGETRNLVVSTSDTGNPLTASVDPSSSSVCSLSDALVITALANGTCNISVSYPADRTYLPASALIAITVGAGSPPPPPPTGGLTLCPAGRDSSCFLPFSVAPTPISEVVGFSMVDGPIGLYSTSSSGAVRVRSISKNICTVSSGMLTTLGLGTCNLVVSQAAAPGYAATPKTNTTFFVTAAAGDLNFNDPMVVGSTYTASTSFYACDSVSAFSNCTTPIEYSVLRRIKGKISLNLSVPLQWSKVTFSGSSVMVSLRIAAGAQPGTYSDFPTMLVSSAPRTQFPLFGAMNYTVAG